MNICTSNILIQKYVIMNQIYIHICYMRIYILLKKGANASDSEPSVSIFNTYIRDYIYIYINLYVYIHVYVYMWYIQKYLRMNMNMHTYMLYDYIYTIKKAANTSNSEPSVYGLRVRVWVKGMG
jgi:hypothetical protein